MKILSFEAAMAKIDYAKHKHLILGNGFSISLKPDIFRYGSLLESADFTKAPNVRQLFETLDTQDFELVIKHLVDASTVMGVYCPADHALKAQLLTDAEVVKDALVSAIAKRHPDRPFDILEAQYVSCRNFLSKFDHIYTLNYDILLYWTLMNSDVDELNIRPDDGFRNPEHEESYVTWQQGQSATVHYLHGALHLFDAGTEIVKYTWSKSNIPIVDQVRAALNENKYPLFVAEGTTDSKLDKIMHSAYLHKSLRSLEQCASNGRSAFVIFGHSLAENDNHILRCLGRGKTQTILVSVYGDPDAPENRIIAQNAARLVQYRKEMARGQALEIIFYHADSASVWG